MQIPYDPEHLSPAVLREIHYYMALTALRKLCAPGDTPYQLYRRAAVAPVSYTHLSGTFPLYNGLGPDTLLFPAYF